MSWRHRRRCGKSAECCAESRALMTTSCGEPTAFARHPHDSAKVAGGGAVRPLLVLVRGAGTAPRGASRQVPHPGGHACGRQRGRGPPRPFLPGCPRGAGRPKDYRHLRPALLRGSSRGAPCAAPLVPLCVLCGARAHTQAVLAGRACRPAAKFTACLSHARANMVTVSSTLKQLLTMYMHVGCSHRVPDKIARMRCA